MPRKDFKQFKLLLKCQCNIRFTFSDGACGWEFRTRPINFCQLGWILAKILVAVKCPVMARALTHRRRRVLIFLMGGGARG
jgi:hypothetical protein